ncbi:hypothetical protein [Antarctobacter heliothermus]|uniref:hypothetical protein n=1 Tax=Antarctobacter heliothermus TaxID=74033 RepID=UPI0014837529|nr:hypothetical protein [Antarctobacter heliothermus]
MTDLGATKGRVHSSAVAVLPLKTALNLGGIARGLWRHGQQPAHWCLKNMIAAILAERAADFYRTVQHEASAHACRGVGVDLVERAAPPK